MSFLYISISGGVMFLLLILSIVFLPVVAGCLEEPTRFLEESGARAHYSSSASSSIYSPPRHVETKYDSFFPTLRHTETLPRDGEGEHIGLTSQPAEISPLSSYFSKTICQAEASSQQRCTKALQVVKVVAGIVGSSTGISFISSSLKAGRAIGVHQLGWVIAGAEVIAYGGKVSWVMTEAVDKFKPKSEEEKIIFKQTTCKSCSKHLACNLLGVVASIPLTYLSYKYNDFKPLALLTFLGSYSTRTLGYHKLLDQVSSLLFKPALTEDLRIFKTQVVNKVKVTQLRFLKMSDAERDIAFQELSQRSTLKEVYEFLFPEEPDTDRTVVSPDSWGRGIPRKFTLAISSIVPVGNALVNIVASYKGATMLYDNNVFAGGVIVLSVLPNFALDLYVASTVAGNLFDSVYNTCRKRETPNFMTALYPKAKYIIPALAFTTTLLSLGNDAFMGSDTLKDSFFSQAMWPLTGLLVASNIQFKTYAITDLLYNVCTSFTAICRKPKRKIINFIKHLNVFSYFVANSDKEAMSSFFQDVRT